MRQLKPLLHYLRPYWFQVGISVVLLAAVGLLQAFRLLLIGPVFQRVLNPSISNQGIALFRIPGTHYVFHLQALVPDKLHNDWTVVAFALVVSTLLKGICDYTGTYLVNYGGFGMVTDLRNDVYKAVVDPANLPPHHHRIKPQGGPQCPQHDAKRPGPARGDPEYPARDDHRGS